jgi:hypothetical protein
MELKKYIYSPNLLTKKSRFRTNTVKSIIAHINKTGEGYEVIVGPCIPYYDFDSSYDTELDRAANYQTDLDTAVDQLKNKYPDGKIYEFTACGFDPIKNKYKNSFHFKIRCVGFHNTASEVHKLDCFDQVPYNNGSQLFRLPYCSKAGQDRILKRFNSSDGTTYELDRLPEHFSEYLIQNILNEELIPAEPKEPAETAKISVSCVDVDFYIDKVKSHSTILDNMIFKCHTEYDNKIIINFRRAASEYCETCERTHDRDATPYITILLKSNKIFYACIRNKTSVFICKVDEDKPCIDAIRIDNLDKIGTKVNQQYCADIPEFMDSIKTKQHGTIIIKSNMGTGKTYAVAKAINATNGKKTGVISFRISLAKKYTEDFHGFINYSDVKERVIDVDNWVCQLDSLYRIKPQTLDYLVLDEVSQIRKHLTATTFMSNKNFIQNRASLRYNIKTAGQVIIMDANATEADRAWINSMRVSDELIIVNEYVKGGVEVIFNSKAQVIKRIQDDFNAGYKCIVAHNGAAEKQLALGRQIAGDKSEDGLITCNSSDVLVINSMTMMDENVKAALNSPNIEFGKYKLVIMSPTAQSGLSYDIPDIFTSIYGIFGSASNSSGDACQMLNRVRHPISKKQYVCVEQYNFGEVKPTTAITMKEYLTNSKKHIFKKSNKSYDVDIMGLIERIPFDYNDMGEIEFSESELIDEFCINKAEHNLDSILYKKNFIKHQLSYGNTIVDDKKKDTDIEKKLIVDLKISVASVKMDIAEDIHDSPDLIEPDADKLKQKMNDTPEKVCKSEYNSIKKYNLKKFYNVENEAYYNINWYNLYMDATVKKHYYTQNMYINKSFDNGLKQLKKREIIKNIYCGLKDVHNSEGGTEPERKATGQYIVDTLLTTSRYIKHKILLGWLDELKYTGLDDFHTTPIADLKNMLSELKNNLTETTFKKLGKQPKNLEKIKLWNHADKDFLKNMLAFINGPLKSEFGLSIKRHGFSKIVYSLSNMYIPQILAVNDPQHLLQIFDVGQNHINTPYKPIVGKIEIMPDSNNYKKFLSLETDSPYDSDENYSENDTDE